MVATFQNLCKLADFGVETPRIEEPKTEVVVKKEEKPEAETKVDAGEKHFKTLKEIHINIQLHLPETKDATIYDNLFKSMKKYLLSDDDE